MKKVLINEFLCAPKAGTQALGVVEGFHLKNEPPREVRFWAARQGPWPRVSYFLGKSQLLGLF